MMASASANTPSFSMAMDGCETARYWRKGRDGFNKIYRFAKFSFDVSPVCQSASSASSAHQRASDGKSQFSPEESLVLGGVNRETREPTIARYRSP